MGYTHGTRWTDEEITEKIIEIVKFSHLDRMPTRKEVEQYCGDTSLTNAITRRKGGWYALAEKMQLPIKECETTFGKSHEKIIMERLISMGYEVRRMPQNFPYDLLVNDRVKVDVKASRLYHGTGGNFYSFNLEKPFCTCDIYVLRMIGEGGIEVDTLVVPSKVVSTNTQISVGEITSKYHRFSQKWKYISAYCSFMDSVG